MKNFNLSFVLHTLTAIVGNGVVFAFVPEQYKELAAIIGNLIVTLSALYDKSHAIASGYVAGK